MEKYTLDYTGQEVNELLQKVNDTTVPTKVGDLTNDTGFITNTVDNLTNYYKKTETYTQTEVNSLINAITTLNIQVVTALPTSNISSTTIYLKGANTSGTNDYEEWIYVNGGWELIGTTAIDLTPYATKTYVDGKATLSAMGVTATAAELNYVDGVTSKVQTQLNAKAALASPTFTGTPKAPTAAAGTNTTQLATTAFVQSAVKEKVIAEVSNESSVSEISLTNLNLAIGKRYKLYISTAWTGSSKERSIYLSIPDNTNDFVGASLEVLDDVMLKNTTIDTQNLKLSVDSRTGPMMLEVDIFTTINTSDNTPTVYIECLSKELYSFSKCMIRFLKVSKTLKANSPINTIKIQTTGSTTIGVKSYAKLIEIY